MLTLAVLLLAIGGVGLQLGVERVLSHDVALGSSDEARLSLQINEIEAEITSSFSAQQIDASADDDAAAELRTSRGHFDPMTPNENGEYEVQHLPPTLRVCSSCCACWRPL